MGYLKYLTYLSDNGALPNNKLKQCDFCEKFLVSNKYIEEEFLYCSECSKLITNVFKEISDNIKETNDE